MVAVLVLLCPDGRYECLCLLEYLSMDPTPARIRLVKQFLQDYIVDTHEDDELDGPTCATSADNGISQRADRAMGHIETLYRIQDLKILYQKVVVRFRREILTSYADPSRDKNEAL